MLWRIIIGALIVMCPSFVLGASLDDVGAVDVPVSIEAEHLEFDTDAGFYRASGDVKLVQGALEVYSENLEWDVNSGDVTMSGDVRMISPNEELSGSTASYNLNAGTGIIRDGRFFLREENFRVRGESIERLGELDYRIFDGIFTTCNGDVPDWKFGASQVDITLGGYAQARHTIFYIKDIPTFYFPYMLYPTKTERESGLLIPEIGYSSKRGFQYGGAYYQVLGVNQDATLYLDYLSKMGLGKGLEYRYIFGSNNSGEARIYHIYVDEYDDVPVNEDAYALEWHHNGWLPGEVRMVIDAEYVNNDEYFEYFGSVAEEYNKDKVQSLMSLSKSWGKYSLVGQAKYTKDLEKDDPTTLQLLPRITFDATRQRFGKSIFYGELETEYTKFWRREGLTGDRALVRPTLSAMFDVWNAVDITPEISYRENYYWGLNDGSHSRHQGIAEFTTRVNTMVQRIYDRPLSFSGKLRHTIEPEVVYSYTPDVDQSTLPDFDSNDRIKPLNQVEYALVQRLTLRSDSFDRDSTYRDLLYLRISQPYSFADADVDRRWLDLRVEMKLLPTAWTSVASDTTFDVDTGDWSKVAVVGRIWDKSENSLQLKYHYNVVDTIDYGEVDLSIGFFKPLYLNYKKRYDFTTNEELEQVFGVGFRRHCWSALVSYREHDDDREIMFTITMRGVGSVGSGFGGL